MNAMLKRTINYSLDFLLAFSGNVVLATSAIVWFVLPRGVGLHGAMYCNQRGRGMTGNCRLFLDLPRYSWIDIHNWAAVVLFVIVAAHIILHWNWIVEATKRIRRMILGPLIKATELYLAAVALFTLFIFECLSGLILWLVVPRGAGDYYNMLSGSGRRFLGLQRNVWVDLHAWAAVAIISIIMIHLILNWSWLVSNSKKLLLLLLRPALPKFRESE